MARTCDIGFSNSGWRTAHHPCRSATNAVAPATGLICALAALALSGCRTTLPHDPTTTRPAVPTDSNAELMEYIADQPYVSADAAGRAVYVLWRGEMPAGDYDSVVAALREAKVVGGGMMSSPDELVTRAAVGYMICRALDIRSGLNWRLTGLGRYAWRELQYRRIAGPGTESRLISGGEFLGVLSRAGEYLAKQQPEADGAIPLGATEGS